MTRLRVTEGNTLVLPDGKHGPGAVIDAAGWPGKEIALLTGRGVVAVLPEKVAPPPVAPAVAEVDLPVDDAERDLSSILDGTVDVVLPRLRDLNLVELEGLLPLADRKTLREAIQRRIDDLLEE